MELIIAELSRYIIVILFALYTFYSYRAFIGRAAGNNEGVFRAQRVLIVMLHLVCSAVILVEEKEIKYVVLWALELFFFLFFTKIYQVFYKGMSKLIWNNMMICILDDWIYYAWQTFLRLCNQTACDGITCFGSVSFSAVVY